MKHLSRSLAIALAVCLMLLTACGGGGTSGGSSKTLTVWDAYYFPTENQKSLEAIDAAFEQENPGVVVKHVGVPYASFAQKLRAAMAARSGPDVVSVYPGVFAAEYSQGLQPLNDAISPELAGQVQLLDDSKAPDGNLYAVPWTSYAFVWYLNKALFQKAGVPVPSTWDEFLTSCQQLRAAGVQPISAGWKDGYLLDWLHFIFLDMLLTDDQLHSLQSAELPLNSEPMVESLQLVHDMQAAGCFADGADGRTIVDFQDQFSQGKAAMLLDVGLPAKIQSYGKAIGQDNIDILAPPMVPNAAQTGPLVDMGPNNGYGVTRWAANSALAKKYVAFLVSKKAQTFVWTKDQKLPNNSDVSLSSDSPVEQKLFDYLRLPANRTTYLALPASVTAEMERRAAGVVSGEVSAASVLDDMESAMAKQRPRLTR